MITKERGKPNVVLRTRAKVQEIPKTNLMRKKLS